MAQKQEKKIQIDSNVELEGDLNKTIENLTNMSKTYPGYHRFELEQDYDDYDYGYNVIVLWGYRWETDKELASRLEKAKKRKERDAQKKAQKLDKEREEYERLKKKFESPKPFGNY